MGWSSKYEPGSQVDPSSGILKTNSFCRPDNFHSWDSDDFFSGSNLILRAKVTGLSDWKEYVTFQNWGKGGGIVFSYYQFGSILLLGILKCSGYGDLPFAGGGGFQKKTKPQKRTSRFLEESCQESCWKEALPPIRSGKSPRCNSADGC